MITVTHRHSPELPDEPDELLLEDEDELELLLEDEDELLLEDDELLDELELLLGRQQSYSFSY